MGCTGKFRTSNGNLVMLFLKWQGVLLHELATLLCT